jgi:hypothetical protein
MKLNVDMKRNGDPWMRIYPQHDSPGCQTMLHGDGTHTYTKSNVTVEYRWPDGGGFEREQAEARKLGRVGI